jgi:hypothetical protein
LEFIQFHPTALYEAGKSGTGFFDYGSCSVVMAVFFGHQQ